MRNRVGETNVHPSFSMDHMFGILKNICKTFAKKVFAFCRKPVRTISFLNPGKKTEGRNNSHSE